MQHCAEIWRHCGKLVAIATSYHRQAAERPADTQRTLKAAVNFIGVLGGSRRLGMQERRNRCHEFLRRFHKGEVPSVLEHS